MAGNGLILRNATELLTLEGASRKQGRRPLEEDLGLLKKAALVCRKGRIEWVGPDSRLPKSYAREDLKEVSAKGRTVLPGFVECHTHSVFAGQRATEFELRNQGVSYQEIAARGGGILSTVTATRRASVGELASLAQDRADRFLRQGVTTLEIKSGYGLSLKEEIKMLEAAGRVKGPRVVRTFLGAHAVPKEFSSAGDYLEHLANEALPRIRAKGLAERVDIFIEKGFFEGAAAELYLAKARALGFQTVVHADQLSLSGGTAAALKHGSLSADHVIRIQDPEIRKLALSEVTSVLLPAADLYMRCPYPPARELIDAGARVALATDFNPGTSPTQDLALVGLLARLQMKMTLAEVITAYTVGAAHALGRASGIGSLEVGKCADFLSINEDWRTLFYSAGHVPESEVYISGKRIRPRSLKRGS